MRLLNASGCLDALAAPEVARTLDAYVTKTVTPLPREGNAPVRIAETELGEARQVVRDEGVDTGVRKADRVQHPDVGLCDPHRTVALALKRRDRLGHEGVELAHRLGRGERVEAAAGVKQPQGPAPPRRAA